MKIRHINTAAFSLVEVTLALGVTAFCLLTLFGLLPIGVRSHKAAAEQTAANAILAGIVSDLRATPPTSPPRQATTSQRYAIPIPANPVTAETTTTFYFTPEGKSDTTLKPESRYRVTVTFPTNGTPQAATMATLTLTWPAPASDQDSEGRVKMFTALDRN